MTQPDITAVLRDMRTPLAIAAADEIERLRLELVAAQPLYSRRQIEAEIASLKSQVEGLRKALANRTDPDWKVLADARAALSMPLEDRK